MMQLETRLKCVGSSLRASGAWQDGTKAFTGRRLRLVGRLSGIAEKLARSIGKIARNMLGDHQRRTARLTARNAGGCQITRVRSLSWVVMYDCNP
ncbi:hypothetical protein BHE74_00042450 [Ensete ventricosum]|nr:hypothetical protein BHE74_00042450 [Ensete ventricosum]